MSRTDTAALVVASSTWSPKDRCEEDGAEESERAFLSRENNRMLGERKLKSRIMHKGVRGATSRKGNNG